MLAKRKLAPIKDLTDAINKTDALPSARSGSVTLDRLEAAP
jgi:hypothetical protein